MTLKIELYDLSGEGPLQTARGRLRRIEPLGEGMEQKTRASSIRPSELNIGFEAESRSVIGSGNRVGRQDSFAHLVTRELKKDRDVVYGKISIEYTNKYSEQDEYEADFSLKFTDRDELEHEIFDFLPWAEDAERHELGG